MYIKLLVYGILGLLIIFVNIWYFGSLWKLIVADKTDVIYPFQISGDSDNKKGTILAHLLRGKLSKIFAETESSRTALHYVDTVSSNEPSIQIVRPPIELPDEVFKPMDLKLSVSGVEVGGLISSLLDWSKTERAINISISKDDKNYIISGNLSTENSGMFYFKKENCTDEEIIDEIAYSIAKEKFAKEYSTINALTVEEFKTLLVSLTALQDNQVKEKYGRRVSDEEYNNLFTSLDNLLLNRLKWEQLSLTVASLAERVGKYEKALYFYRSAQNSQDKRELDKHLAEKITSIERKLAAIKGGELINPILKLIHMTDDAAIKQKGKIAIIGSLSNEQLTDLKKTMHITQLSSSSDQTFQNHTFSILSVFKWLIPDAEFVLALEKRDSTGQGILNDSDILAAIEKILEHGSADVILIPLGPPTNFLSGERYKTPFRRIYQYNKTLVVLPCGNYRKEELQDKPTISFDDLPDNVYLANSTDLQGIKSGFAAEMKDGLWVPGENIPIQTQSDNGLPILNSGTTYASVITTAIIAKLAAKFPNKKDSIKAVLQNTSSQVSSGSEKIVNYQAAFHALSNSSH